MSKPKKYKVTLELTTGSVHKIRFTDKDDSIGRAFSMIDECWQSSGEKDGFVAFSNRYFKISSIIKYHLKKCWF